MTEKARGARCGWCRSPMAVRARGPGRPRRFCRPGCRQAAYRARQRAAGHGLADDEAIVAIEALEALADGQFALAAALEDVAVDLAEADGEDDVRAALAHLMEACAPVADLRVGALPDRR